MSYVKSLWLVCKIYGTVQHFTRPSSLSAAYHWPGADCQTPAAESPISSCGQHTDVRRTLNIHFADSQKTDLPKIGRDSYACTPYPGRINYFYLSNIYENDLTKMTCYTEHATRDPLLRRQRDGICRQWGLTDPRPAAYLEVEIRWCRCSLWE